MAVRVAGYLYETYCRGQLTPAVYTFEGSYNNLLTTRQISVSFLAEDLQIWAHCVVFNHA